MYVRNQFPRIKKIFSEAAASTAGGTPSILPSSDVGGEYVRVSIPLSTSLVYVSPLSTAPSAANAWAMRQGDSLDIYVSPDGFLAFMSTETASLRQVLVFDV